VDVRARIQSKVRVSSTRITESAATRAVRAVADVKEILEDRQRRIHAARLNSGFWPTSWKFDDTCGAAGIVRTSTINPSLTTKLDFIAASFFEMPCNCLV